jgi:Cu(I)/Ag(I) efflux system membrane fusion protein
MNGKTLAAVAGAAAVALAAGYFLGRSGQLPADKAASAPMPAGETKSGERKLLYYRNPMGLPDTSPVPKKDPMGMDYIPVYEGEDQGAGTVKVSADRIQTLGVRTETASKRVLSRACAQSARSTSTSAEHTWSPEIRGLIEKACVNTRAGRARQPLAEVTARTGVGAGGT